MNSGDEYDVLTKARKFYSYTQRPKVCKKVKRAYNKKERRWLDRVFIPCVYDGPELGSTSV